MFTIDPPLGCACISIVGVLGNQQRKHIGARRSRWKLNARRPARRAAARVVDQHTESAAAPDLTDQALDRVLVPQRGTHTAGRRPLVARGGDHAGRALFGE